MVRMAAVSGTMRDAFGWLLGFAAVIVLCGAIQWFVPQHSVEPLAARFLCDGVVTSTRAADTRQSDVLSKVTCNIGMRRTDDTTMAFLILTIPCALSVAAATLLVKRVVLPKPRTTIQRAHA